MVSMIGCFLGSRRTREALRRGLLHGYVSDGIQLESISDLRVLREQEIENKGRKGHRNVKERARRYEKNREEKDMKELGKGQRKKRICRIVSDEV